MENNSVGEKDKKGLLAENEKYGTLSIYECPSLFTMDPKIQLTSSKLFKNEPKQNILVNELANFWEEEINKA